jgi:hypothetical protein
MKKTPLFQKIPMDIRSLSSANLVAKLSAHKPEWSTEWEKLKGFSGPEIVGCSEEQLRSMLSLPAAIWLFNASHPNNAKVNTSSLPSLAFIIEAPLEQLDSVCSDESVNLTYRKSCAAEINRRLLRSMALLSVRGTQERDLPSFSEATRNLMKGEGFNIDLFRS